MPSKSQTMPTTLSSADPVLESQILWVRYKKHLFVALVFIFLAVGAWGAFRFRADRRETAAASALGAAKTAADFQKVITDYPGTPAGDSAYMFLAEQQRNDKKFEEANATLQKFVDKNPKNELKATARLAIGANLESLGKLDDALAAYQKLATDDPQSYTAPFAMIGQARVYKQQNKTDDARRVCEAVLTQYRESLLASEAQRQLNMLKGNEPGPGKTLQLAPQNLTPNTGPKKVVVPPQPVPAGPPAAPAAPPIPPKK